MKKIIHIDADSFYASVEVRENPEISSLPIAVGGSPEKRGVVATCNYEARRFGVRSAMSSATALRLCPHLHFISPRMALYKEYSLHMQEIFFEYTDLVEPLSLDEAFLDVSESNRHLGSATRIAEEIKGRIHDNLGITVSAGIASVKFLAKIASDWRKPNGIFVVPPEAMSSFIPPLDVKKLPGVGAVTAKKMARNGIYTCEDLQKYGLQGLVGLFGAYGSRLFQMSQGIDERVVKPDRQRKSISVERTFDTDQRSIADLYLKLDELLAMLDERCNKISASQKKIKKAFVKVKFSDFSHTSVEAPFNGRPSAKAGIFKKLLNDAWERNNLAVRLLGLGFRLEDVSEQQLELDFDSEISDLSKT